MTRVVSILVFVLALAPVPLLAHPGHNHTMMGTVSMVNDNHLEVKATDGKTSMITLDGKTRVLRGTTKVKPGTIKDGERVVVTALETKDKDGKTIMLATEVRLAVAAQPPAARQPKR